MKFLLNSAGLLALALLAAGCAHSHGDDGHNHAPGETCESQTRSEADADEIVISDAAARRLGIEVAEVRPGEFRETVKASGRILSVPSDRAVAVAPAAGTVNFAAGIAPGARVGAGQTLAAVTRGRVSGGNPDAAARAAMEAAKRELDRATPLVADGLVSKKEYAALQAAYEEARAAYSPAAASGAVASPMAGVVTALLAGQGEYVEAGQPVAQVARSQRLTLRADLPLRHASRADALTGANFRPAGSSTTYTLASLGGKQAGGGTPTEADGPYVPIYFTFDNPGGDAVPGLAADVVLLGAPRAGVMAVPVGALTEQMGSFYVYVKIDGHGYERRAVTTGATDGVRTEITSGLNSGDMVVIAGATALCLAENAGTTADAHGHSH